MTPDHETHIRNDQTRRVMHAVCGSSGPTFLSGGEIRRMLEALILPDQQEASEPLQSARPNSAPVDHGPGADATAETGNDYTRGREQGIRDALEALPSDTHPSDDWNRGWNGYGEVARKYIKDLLPRDPVKALVEEYHCSKFHKDWWNGRETAPLIHECEEHFARWLHSTDRLTTQGEDRNHG